VFVILPFGTCLGEWFVRQSRSLRGESIGMRDVAILWGLHVARALTAVQLAVELFPRQQVAKARNQLNRLRVLGLVERHRGGRVQGSDAYLWTLTGKGFKALEQSWVHSMGDGMVPVAWSTVRLGTFVEWGWKDQIWGSKLPGRVKHDLQAIDFLISYRRCIDAELAKITGGQCEVFTEWRCEHAFLAPWEKGTRYREGGPMGLDRACREGFPESKQSITDLGRHIQQSGFADDRMRVVKPDGAVSIVIDRLPDTIECQVNAQRGRHSATPIALPQVLPGAAGRGRCAGRV
jgi:hypothetical protein